MVTLLLAGAGPVAAQGYTVTDLGTMGGVSSRAAAVNNRGQVVGSIDLTSDGRTSRAFLWQNGAMTDLGSLGGSRSYASGINDAGQIVGGSSLPNDTARHAFLWQNGVMTDLGTLGGSDSDAAGINAAGQIAGTSQIAGDIYEHAFLWQNGVMTDLSIAGSVNNRAAGINAAGQVTGEFLWHEGFLWQAGALRDLGTLGGGHYSQPQAINDRGQVTGTSVLGATTRQAIRAFLADSSGMHDLGTLGGDFSYGFGINRSGDVVGYSNGPSFSGYHAFLYSGGVMKDLNALIPAGSGWVLTAANGINDRGQIVGQGTVGGERHAFLLDPPAPAPPSGLLASVLSSSRIALSWADNSTDETAFALWRQTGSGPFTRIAVLAPDTTGYTDTDVTPGESYTYHVRAIGLGGASDWSNDAGATAQAPALAPPTFLSAAMGPLDTARLAWTDNSDNETAFAIWRRGDGADWTRVGVVPPDTTTFVDTGLLPGTTYDYRVRAINNAGASAWSNEALLLTTPRPAAPSGLTAGVYGANAIGLQWSVSGAEETGITVFRKVGSGDWTPIAALPPGTIQFLDWGLSPQTTYTYRLRAHNNSYASDWSNEAGGTTTQSSP